MYDKLWLRFLVWSTSVFFFFLSAMTLAAMLGPVPKMSQAMAWMSGMEKAMMNSLMGIAMDPPIQTTEILTQAGLVIPYVAIFGVLIGFLLRFRGEKE